tara:strand:+ start:328 stop:579 length:252 start_codon:yes stop_codon:yes gene_type:complete
VVAVAVIMMGLRVVQVVVVVGDLPLQILQVVREHLNRVSLEVLARGEREHFIQLVVVEVLEKSVGTLLLHHKGGGVETVYYLR